MENEVPQPTFPSVGINITPDGCTIIIALAPGFTFSQAIDEDSMNKITKKWIETRKQVKSNLEIVRNLETDKVRSFKR